MRTRWTTLAMTLTLVLTASAATVAARPGPRRPLVADQAQAPGAKPGAARAAKREKVRQRLRLMRTLVMTEQLGLDDVTAGKLMPILGKYDDELAKLLTARAALLAKLAAARGTHRDGELSGLLDQLIANQRARWSSEERRFAELRALLTPLQAATLFELLPDIDRKILRAIRRAVDAAGDDDGAAVRGPRLAPRAGPFDRRR